MFSFSQSWVAPGAGEPRGLCYRAGTSSLCQGLCCHEFLQLSVPNPTALSGSSAGASAWTTECGLSVGDLRCMFGNCLLQCLRQESAADPGTGILGKCCPRVHPTLCCIRETERGQKSHP